MKKVTRMVLVTSLLLSVVSLRAEEIIKESSDNLGVGGQEEEKSSREFNRLTWLEVSKSADSIQLIFDFAQPIYFEQKLDEQKRQLSLSFPGMRLQQFDEKQVMAELNKLKDFGLVEEKGISLFDQNEKYPQVVLTIDFKKKRKIDFGGNKSQKIENRLLIKWCKMEEPNRLVFDIFTKESINQLNVKDAVVLHAHNANTQPEKFRIVLDAGHGGKEFGAECNGLREKDIALDLVARTRSRLEDKGLSVMLTRNSDVDISWCERKELANQLKAHLFVSIHLNSGGLAGAGPSGLETFFFNSKDLAKPSCRSGFLFVNLEKKPGYEELIDKKLQDKTNLSRKLASTIQNSVISLLKTKGTEIVNRGVKTGLFHIFFNNQRPTALVEVGFITNKKEAQRLTDGKYLDFLAQGLCDGITKYISSCKNCLS